MKTALLSVLLFAWGLVDARMRHKKHSKQEDMINALVADSAKCQYFVVNKGDDCAANDTSPESITIKMPEDSERGRTKGRKDRNGPPPLMGEALQAACKNQEGKELCVCQRIVGDSIETSYVRSCGKCVLKLILDHDEDRELDNFMDDLKEELEEKKLIEAGRARGRLSGRKGGRKGGRGRDRERNHRDDDDDDDDRRD